MKKILLFALPLLAMLAVSCEKDGRQNVTDKRVKEIWIEYEDGEKELIYSFTYDSEGRVMRSNHNNYLYETYTYADNAIIATDDDGDGKTIYRLNNDGYLVKKEDHYSSYNGPERLYSTTEYVYNNGYLSKEIYKSYDESGAVEEESTDEYFWKNGNRVIDYAETYEYSSIANLTNINLGYSLESGDDISYLKFKGTYSKNLLSKMVIKEYDGAICTYQWDYTLDKDGLPTQVKHSFWRTEDDKYLTTFYIIYE